MELWTAKLLKYTEPTKAYVHDKNRKINTYFDFGNGANEGCKR